ncbi:MAG: serine/threonine protein kinase [Deltaproteobacteria bacterium]|nr:serine/threonine protein kinase [Deltaproteobacteria bacterium]
MSDSADRLKSPVKTGDVVGGKYRVDRVLGAGGMGVVVAATHVDLDQKVALKFILPQALAGKGNVERFLREARNVVRLKSEHVARVYDVGREAVGDEERPYMVLELLEGMDLAKLNRQKGPLPVADAVEYVLQACEALVEAHALGIVHRDLKPQNIFVTRRLNGTPLVKVLDFGISKAVGPAAEGQMSLTDSTAVIGSPLYMAPEQMRSARSAEIRSDIWALGVILYELLGGQLPFDGETVTEVCIRVVNETPPELIKLRPGLDERLVAIVMRCLEKDVDARFHNVASLATALEPFSRSAQQGGLVRPWRSFEDTQDSQEVRPQPPGAPADATGPATAVTMDSLPPEALAKISEEERRAREGAGSTKASPGVKPPSQRDGEKHPLVSTDTAWGESIGKPPKKTRTFATGLAAGAVVSLAVAAGIVGVMLGRNASPTKSGASAAQTAAANTSPPPASAAPLPPSSVAVGTVAAGAAAPVDPGPVSAKAEPKPATKPAHGAKPLPPMATASGPAGRILGPKGAAAAAARTAEPAAAPPPAATSHPPETKSEPAAPNGAPILH